MEYRKKKKKKKNKIKFKFVGQKLLDANRKVLNQPEGGS